MKLFATHALSDPAPHSGAVVFEDDVRLMRLVASGDVRAQRLLAMRVTARGLRIARSFVGNHSEAEDVMQDCLLEVFRAAPQYRGDAPLEAWASRIVVRRSMRHLKRVKLKRLERETLVDAATLAAHAHADPDNGAALVERLERIVRSLSPDAQLVLRLRFDMGFTVQEVADYTGAPHSTVKKRLLRAIAQVRGMLRAPQDLGGEREMP